jgi:mRNA interferase HigB
LREFRRRHPDAEGPLRAWYAEVKAAAWVRPQDVRDRFAGASIVGGNRIVFDIGGNRYRVVVKINYLYRVVYIRFVGTHAEYDCIDVEQI